MHVHRGKHAPREGDEERDAEKERGDKDGVTLRDTDAAIDCDTVAACPIMTAGRRVKEINFVVVSAAGA